MPPTAHAYSTKRSEGVSVSPDLRHGKHAVEDLRAGVQSALQALGQGLVGHPKNAALRESMRSGGLSPEALHGELLRVVFRLLVLFVADGRAVGGVPFRDPRGDSAAERRERAGSLDRYSVAGLCEVASMVRGGPHGGLWRRFNLLIGVLSGDHRFDAERRRLGLPALGGFLWHPSSTPNLNAPNLAEPGGGNGGGGGGGGGGCELANADFLEAIRHLAYMRRGATEAATTGRPVDFASLGSGELGSVYENLLALTPRISGLEAAESVTFSFAELSGSRRKTSGSYYTPDSLVQSLLDSALDPVVAEAVRGKAGPIVESAILNLRVCDPACGSGRFLVGAAHRLAGHLARARADSRGRGVASPLMQLRALREVIRRCLYGVDLDPMAVELCKVALWMESKAPGWPRGFLDARIKCGNALVGATPALIGAGIPDEAFEPRTGEDKKVLAYYKKRNRRERQSLGGDVGGTARESSKLLADAWCAAFVWKQPGPEGAGGVPGDSGNWDAITERTFRELERDPGSVQPGIRDEIGRLAAEHRFFHWHLEFPEVFRRREGISAQSRHDRRRSKPMTAARDLDRCHGFDVMVGNPPFLNQLETATTTAKGLSAIVAQRSNGLIRGYSDLSAAFLLISTQIVRHPGRIALVQPQSLLAVKDGAAVRAAVLKAGSLEALWVSNEHVFEGVSVFTCAPTIKIGGPRRTTLARSAGAAFTPLPPMALDIDVLAGEQTWAHLAAAASGVPEVALTDAGTVDALADATADFRDQYYGLAGFLVDDDELSPGERARSDDFPPIVTTGLIDLAECRWGAAPTRILKTAWRAPRIDRRRMDAGGALGPWIRARLIPKVLLATQTRVMEVFVDVAGRYVPGIPLITITPTSPERLWHIAAAIASPVCSALALRNYAGAAMNADALKLSARQALRLPIPPESSDWDAAARHFREASAAVDKPARLRALRVMGQATVRAYRVPAEQQEPLLAWWWNRLTGRKLEEDHGKYV